MEIVKAEGGGVEIFIENLLTLPTFYNVFKPPPAKALIHILLH